MTHGLYVMPAVLMLFGAEVDDDDVFVHRAPLDQV